jgi:hypothetical protein
MINQQIRDTFLKALYEAWMTINDNVNWKELCQQEGWSEKEFEKVEHHLVSEGLIIERGVFDDEITARGTIQVEQEGLVSDEIKKSNNDVRFLILKYLYELSEKHSPHHFQHYSTLAHQLGLDEELVLRHIETLEELGHAKPEAVGCFNLSDFGHRFVREQLERISLADEYEEIEKLKPQPRGRSLQKFLAKVLGKGGWSQFEGVRTSNEEMDIILLKEKQYYLIECKWEKKPIGAAVTRELVGKLEDRHGVSGILISMSGFTRGAIEYVEKNANKRICLLFGVGDINAIVYRGQSFEELLDKKYSDLVIHKKASFE